MRHVNYDQIAETYNQRYQTNSLDSIETALFQLAREANAQTILEVGCGTGRWLVGLENHLDTIQLYGIDFSFGMLEQAQKQNFPNRLIQGKASQLALKADTFDLIFCVNALHHFRDPSKFIGEAWKCLHPQGKLAIIGQVPQDRRNRWYVYAYFEGVYEKDLERFPTWGNVMDWMVSAGYERIEWHPLHWIIDDKQGRQVLDDPFLQKHAVSQLAILTESEYAAGIEKIKLVLKLADENKETMIFPARLRLDILVGTKPQED
jgi:SAM-dependent methyltransferase